MNKCKGIRRTGEESYAVFIDLPPRYSKKEKSYRFYIGTVNSLEKAKSIRYKAEEYRYLYGGDCLDELKELKKSISKKKTNVVSALKRILDEHDRIYGDYTLVDEVNHDKYDKETIDERKEEREALEYAIKILKRRTRYDN